MKEIFFFSLLIIYPDGEIQRSKYQVDNIDQCLQRVEMHMKTRHIILHKDDVTAREPSYQEASCEISRR